MQLLLLLLLLSRLAWYELIVRLSIHHPIETGVVRVVVIGCLFPRRQVRVVESCVGYEVVGVVHAEQRVRLRCGFLSEKWEEQAQIECLCVRVSIFRGGLGLREL